MESGEQPVKKNSAILCLYFLVFFLSAACAQRSTLYRWGSYQDSLTRLYSDHDNFEIAKELDLLSSQLDETLSSGERIPPGLYAHLGYLYDLSGDSEAAVSHMLEEKKLFPESAVFIDGILKRMKR